MNRLLLGKPVLKSTKRITTLADRSAKLEGIQFLRFVAAIMVVFFHASIFVAQQFPDRNLSTLLEVTKIGAAGVPIFFAISGFIMLHTSTARFAKNGAALGFAKRRLIRIFPVYWLMLLPYFLWLPTDLARFPENALEFVGTVLLVPGHAATIITPAWSLAYEMYFYLIFTAMILLPKPQAMAGLFAVFGLAILAGALLDARSGGALVRTVTSPALLEFLAGVAIGLVLEQKGLMRYMRRPFVNGLFWVSILLFGLSVNSNNWFSTLPEVIRFGIPGSMLVGWAVFSEELRMLPQFVRKLSWLGDSSYALYLVHVLVLALATPLISETVFGGLDSPMIVLGVIVSCAMVVSLAVYYGLEKPIQKALHRCFLRPQT